MHQNATAMSAKFRVHIKSHKTIQGTAVELQELGGEGRIICSTPKEIEYIAPLIRDGTILSVRIYLSPVLVGN
jgi:D-serine deaminase-like pyridoxal phosphate-dependent protein